jgi:hypothetical protein
MLDLLNRPPGTSPTTVTPRDFQGLHVTRSTGIARLTRKSSSHQRPLRQGKFAVVDGCHRTKHTAMLILDCIHKGLKEPLPYWHRTAESNHLVQLGPNSADTGVSSLDLGLRNDHFWSVVHVENHSTKLLLLTGWTRLAFLADKPEANHNMVHERRES